MSSGRVATWLHAFEKTKTKKVMLDDPPGVVHGALSKLRGAVTAVGAALGELNANSSQYRGGHELSNADLMSELRQLQSSLTQHLPQARDTLDGWTAISSSSRAAGFLARALLSMDEAVRSSLVAGRSAPLGRVLFIGRPSGEGMIDATRRAREHGLDVLAVASAVEAYSAVVQSSEQADVEAVVAEVGEQQQDNMALGGQQHQQQQQSQGGSSVPKEMELLAVFGDRGGGADALRGPRPLVLIGSPPSDSIGFLETHGILCVQRWELLNVSWLREAIERSRPPVTKESAKGVVQSQKSHRLPPPVPQPQVRVLSGSHPTSGSDSSRNNSPARSSEQQQQQLQHPPPASLQQQQQAPYAMAVDSHLRPGARSAEMDEDMMMGDGSLGSRTAKRIKRACLHCHTKKVQCNGGRPCSRCVAAGRVCHEYEPIRRRGSRGGAGGGGNSNTSGSGGARNNSGAPFRGTSNGGGAGASGGDRGARAVAAAGGHAVLNSSTFPDMPPPPMIGGGGSNGSSVTWPVQLTPHLLRSAPPMTYELVLPRTQPPPPPTLTGGYYTSGVPPLQVDGWRIPSPTHDEAHSPTDSQEAQQQAQQQGPGGGQGPGEMCSGLEMLGLTSSDRATSILRNFMLCNPDFGLKLIHNEYERWGQQQQQPPAPPLQQQQVLMQPGTQQQLQQQQQQQQMAMSQQDMMQSMPDAVW